MLPHDEYHWERRQTLTNCERYISPALKEKESMILNAEENIIDLEYKLFCSIKSLVKEEVPSLNATADALSEIDALVSLSVCSEEYNLVRPNITDEHVIDIKNGRHPVVEVVSKSEYVPNDCLLSNGINTLLITGPNMSGKSTYMRQMAIIVIMAQMGSQMTTTNPAPAERRTSRTFILKPVGAPVSLALSLKEYCVLAMQTGSSP